jgi:nitrite reductase/ring-hydroxylating ferredoxin subunit
MRAGSGHADDPQAGTQQPESAADPSHAPGWLVTWHSDLLTRVDQLDWLRRLNDWLTGVLGPVRERYQDNLVLELLHGGRWVGHPLHPALSDLPIGLWTSATLLDAADRSPAPRPGLDAAGLLSAAGTLTAGATVLTGVSDWAVSNDQDRRIGLFHGLLNTAALGLQGASLAARMTGHRSSARALGATGLAVTAGAAYFGGHLVFTKGVMVNRVGWATGPRRWVRALEESGLPDDSPVAVEAEGRQVLLYRHHGGLYAIDNICSHAGGLLSRGPVADLIVTCPLHGSRFSSPTVASCAARPASRNPCYVPGSATAGLRCAAASRHPGALRKGHSHDVRSRREP